jgi:tetratricopeptide (TPR) repeat protein
VSLPPPPGPGAVDAAGLRGEVVRPKVVRVGEVPTEPPDYQPRGVLLRELQQAAVRDGLAVVHALTGMRGVGKTQLAAGYARGRIAQGWPVVCWVTAESVEQLVGGLAELAAELGLRHRGDDDVTAARSARRWLEGADVPVLLVLDNAEDPAAVLPWLPTGGQAHVVITTTNQAFTTVAASVDVAVFTPEQAATYLDRRTGLNDPQGAAQVAEALGHLPLALAQAAWLITSRGRTYGDYLVQLRSRPLAQALTATASYPHVVAEAVLLSVGQAESADATGTTRALLDTLAFLSPAGVARSVLTALTGAHEGDVDAALGALAGASLVTYSVDHTHVIMHRLIQRTLRDRAQRENTLTGTVDRLACRLLESTVGLDRGRASRAESVQLIDQITALTEHSPALCPKVRGDTAHSPDCAPSEPVLLRLRLWAVQYLEALSDYSRAIALGDALTHDAELLLGEDHPLALDALESLATACSYYPEGQPGRAVALLQRILAIHARTRAPDDPRALATRTNLAGAYQQAGLHSDALALVEQVLADYESTLGPDHPLTLRSRSDVALTYHYAGRPSDAVPISERVLADYERTMGSDRSATMFLYTLRNNLAGAYNDAGRHTEAITLHQQNIDAEEHAYDADDPKALTSRHNLANAYRNAGRLTEAITLHLCVFADCERVLGSDHPQTLSSCFGLATCYTAAGRHEEAVALHEEVLADSERILGPDHRHTRQSRQGLADARLAAVHKAALTWLPTPLLRMTTRRHGWDVDE